jgi:hypothetical protein
MNNVQSRLVIREVEENLNKKNMPRKAELSDLIQYFNLEATKQDVKDWQRARLDAIDVFIPDWTDLIRVYDDVMVDAHLTGIIETIKDRIKATGFELVNENGEQDDRTEYFEKQWFFKFLDWAVEARYYPYSLVQLGDMVDNGFPEIELIKREYCTPNREFVKKSLETYGTYKHGVDGWKYTDPSLRPYFIMIESPIELGFLDRVATHALGKKYMLQYLWRYVELFGSPTRIGKTDIKDPERRKNMELMMSNMGNALWGVVDPDDEVELVSASGSSSSMPHLEAIDKANSEMNKALLGTDSMGDEQSFVGSAEVGERIFETKGTGILRDLKFLINDVLIPRMLHYQIDVKGLEFRWKVEEKISFENKLEAAKVLLPYYDIPEEELKDLGFEVTKKETSQEQIIQAIKKNSKSIVAETNNMYKNSK